MLLKNTKFNIVIPCFNEEKTIASTIEDFLSISPSLIIVVDDCSTDKSVKILKKYPVTVLHNNKNSGAGYSLNKGLQYSSKLNNSDYTITADADGQHKSDDIYKLVKAIENENIPSDVVYGIRLLKLRTTPIIKFFTNFMVQIVMFCLYGSTIKDPYCGLRAYKNDFIERLTFRDGFDWPIDLLLKLKEKNTRANGVYIEAHYTEYSLKKGQNIKSGIKLLMRIIRNRILELAETFFVSVLQIRIPGIKTVFVKMWQ